MHRMTQEQSAFIKREFALTESEIENQDAKAWRDLFEKCWQIVLDEPCEEVIVQSEIDGVIEEYEDLEYTERFLMAEKICDLCAEVLGELEPDDD